MQSIHLRIAVIAQQHEAARDHFDTRASLTLDGKTQWFSITYLMRVDPSLMLLRASLLTSLDADDRYVQCLLLPP